jgi:hypothetical protein
MDDRYAGFESKVCPDCAREGNAEPQAPENFFIKKAARYKGGFRLSTYCRRHEAERNTARQAERLATNPEVRQKKRAADLEFAKRHKEQHAAKAKLYRERHPEKEAERYAAWAKRNPEQRRQTQDAWREKKRLRGRVAAPPTDPTLKRIRKELEQRDRDLQRDKEE